MHDIAAQVDALIGEIDLSRPPSVINQQFRRALAAATAHPER